MGLKDRLEERREKVAADKDARSPAGQARAAREADQPLFQLVLPVEDAQEALAAVAAEGWQLAHVATVWKPKDVTTGSNIATLSWGTLMGVYVFTPSRIAKPAQLLP